MPAPQGHSPTWRSETEPAPPTVTPMGWFRVVARGVPLAIVIFGGLAVHLALRGVERPVWGQARPITPHITQAVCRAALAIIGLRFRCEGAPMAHPGAIVANHSSWLDIFALNARQRVYFVSKAEVAGWPGIGWLARATGTVFIDRDRKAAARQVQVFQQRLMAGHRLVFFPEGTSTDGRRVLEFKPTLFAAFLVPALRGTLWLQPVSVIYRAPAGADARVYGWWGGMDFGPHLAGLLAMRRHGSVTLVYHAPVAVAAFDDRKALASATQAEVRAGLAAAGVLDG